MVSECAGGWKERGRQGKGRGGGTEIEIVCRHSLLFDWVGRSLIVLGPDA